MSDIETTDLYNSGLKKNIQKSPYFAMIVLFLGVFIMGLDLFIFSPALVTIVSYFHTSFNWVSWTITVYLLFTTAVMPLAGNIADRFGRKKLYIIGVSLFTVGSFLCSLSWDIYSLVFFRAIQAIGGGIIVPTALSAMSSFAPKDKQGKTLGVLMAGNALASIIGPNIGGYLIDNFGWRSIFYINIPFGIITILLTLKLKETYSESKKRIDIIGSIILIGTIFSLVFGLIGLETLPFTDIGVLPYFILTLVLFIILIIWEKHTTDPILNIPLLFQRNVLILNIGTLLTFAASTVAIIFIPTFAQLILKSGITASGSILTPLSISILVLSITGGLLADKYGTKYLLIVSTLINAIGFFVLASFTGNYFGLAIILVVIGIGLGIANSSFPVALFSVVPESEKGTTIAIMKTFGGIGSILSPVIGGYYLTNATSKIISFSSAFNDIFTISYILLLVTALLLIINFSYSRVFASRY